MKLWPLTDLIFIYEMSGVGKNILAPYPQQCQSFKPNNDTCTISSGRSKPHIRTRSYDTSSESDI
jgi:hypothetical protein